MAEVTVGHHPELTAQEAMKVFQKHFSKYEFFEADKWPVCAMGLLEKKFLVW